MKKSKITRKRQAAQPLIARARERAVEQAKVYLALSHIERVEAKMLQWAEQSLNAACLATALEHTTREWYWSESAILMTEVLRLALVREGGIFRLALPFHHLYIELATPFLSPKGEVAAICLVNHGHKEEYLEMLRWFQLFFAQVPENQRHFTRMARRIEDHFSQGSIEPTWTVHLLGSDGACLFTVLVQTDVITEEVSSRVIAFPFCLTCEQGAEQSRISSPCSHCKATYVLTLSWIFIALQMLDGVYQQTPPADEEGQPSAPSEIRIVTETREEPAEQSWKTPRIHQKQHRMQVLRFDACLKPQYRVARHPRGSWLAGRPIEEAVRADLDPGAVVYVDRSYGYERTYSADRYKKSGLQGKKQHIQVPRRRVPVTVGALLATRRTRVHVRASAYTSERSSEIQVDEQKATDPTRDLSSLE